MPPTLPPKPKLTIDGATYYTDDLTLDEIALCEDDTGESWLLANPYRSAKWIRAITVRILARTIGEDEAKVRVGKQTVKETLAGVEMAYDDDRPDEHMDGVPLVDPKEAEADSATTG